MKLLFALPFMLLLVSCKEANNNNMNSKVRPEPCTCEARPDSDTVFFATKVQLQEMGDKKIIHYNCAAIAIAIASVNDETGMERCENIYELECVGTVKDSLILSDSFTYFAEELAAMDLTREGAQNLFYEALKSKPTPYFEFTVGNKELRAISKIKMQ
ncbi:MAG: hypothetical protein EOP54_01320 [Sphingobacteriales bacterium]|nr:MAG: hypothetical protein EOP54_01320 [Sphingobacteriales bacterium]